MKEINKYISLNVLKLHQIQNGVVVVGKLKFTELLEIYKLTERQENYSDPYTPKKEKEEIEEQFQRQLSQNKLTKIIKYLNENLDLVKNDTALGLFPTSLIISLEHDIEYTQQDLNNQKLEIFLKKNFSRNCFIKKEKNSEYLTLFIPKNNGISLIVDGQHRFVGFKNFYEQLNSENKELVKNFEFSVTILVGFDLYQIGQVFANVNFTQKPVNRSLYYDIFGSVPGQLADISLAHDITLHMNNYKKSPLFNMIKLLGKGNGLFSQAFFVKRILSLIGKKGIWYDIYLDYINGGKQYVKIVSFLKIYFNIIKKSYPECWALMNFMNKDSGELNYNSREYGFVLCKPTGIGAFFRLITDIYPVMSSFSEDEISFKLLKIFEKISNSDAKELFSSNGRFGSMSSEGTVTRLYRELKLKYELNF
jgi:DGQHR domain-containing protein